MKNLLLIAAMATGLTFAAAPETARADHCRSFGFSPSYGSYGRYNSSYYGSHLRYHPVRSYSYGSFRNRGFGYSPYGFNRGFRSGVSIRSGNFFFGFRR